MNGRSDKLVARAYADERTAFSPFTRCARVVPCHMINARCFIDLGLPIAVARFPQACSHAFNRRPAR